MIPSENETWLIDCGDDVIQKKAEQGRQALTACERLTYCVWVADYSMRNADDLTAASDLYPQFQEEAVELAGELGLARTREAFSLPTGDLERAYFDAFDEVCAELRACRCEMPHSAC